MKPLVTFIVGAVLTVPVLTAQNTTIQVLGGVSRPGAYSVDRAGTISHLIKEAGGLADRPGDEKAVIYRPDHNGTPHEIQVAIKDVLNHKVADVALQAGDIVYVPAPHRIPLTQPVIDDRIAQ